MITGLKKGAHTTTITPLNPKIIIQGENDVEELTAFLRVLLDVGFLNTKNPPIVSFEVKPLSGEPSKVVIANDKRVLREAWAKV